MTDRSEQSGQRRLDPKLLEILVCPLTKTTLAYDAERQELISRAAGYVTAASDTLVSRGLRKWITAIPTIYAPHASAKMGW